jgi:hypothetical protein
MEKDLHSPAFHSNIDPVLSPAFRSFLLLKIESMPGPGHYRPTA